MKSKLRYCMDCFQDTDDYLFCETCNGFVCADCDHDHDCLDFLDEEEDLDDLEEADEDESGHA